MSFNDLLQHTDRGLYCPKGDCFIDPWRPVDTALITHAHADHARWGHTLYKTTLPGLGILTERMEATAHIEAVPYNQPFKQGDVWVTFYPAGHILGSAQICLEYHDQRIVISGDYKRSEDATCQPFEPVPCNVFVTEATFALPVYSWPPLFTVMQDVLAWWQQNAIAGKTSILFSYSLGKAQRLLSGFVPLMGETPLPYVFCHAAIEALNKHYRAEQIILPVTRQLPEAKLLNADPDISRALVLAPPSCQHNGWLKRFNRPSTAFASGWMALRSSRRQRGVDKGFVVSDHTDWPDLLQTIDETRADHVWVTHGRADVLVRYLQDKGINAQPLKTAFGQEDE